LNRFFYLQFILPCQRMRTPANCFIGNLALADLLMAALCIPFSYWPVLILQHWIFGIVMCKVIHFLQVFAVMLSAHTLIIISLDRLARTFTMLVALPGTISCTLVVYTRIHLCIQTRRFWAIMYPLHHQLSNREAVKVLACVWTLDVAIA